MCKKLATLCLVVLAMSLTACGGGNGGNTQQEIITLCADFSPASVEEVEALIDDLGLDQETVIMTVHFLYTLVNAIENDLIEETPCLAHSRNGTDGEQDVDDGEDNEPLTLEELCELLITHQPTTVVELQEILKNGLDEETLQLTIALLREFLLVVETELLIGLDDPECQEPPVDDSPVDPPFNPPCTTDCGSDDPPCIENCDGDDPPTCTENCDDPEPPCTENCGGTGPPTCTTNCGGNDDPEPPCTIDCGNDDLPTLPEMGTVCHKGRKTLTLPLDAVAEHIAHHGDDFPGECILDEEPLPCDDCDNDNDNDNDDTPPVKVILCHKPGTPAEKTLDVPVPAVSAHLGHGDIEGACVVPE